MFKDYLFKASSVIQSALTEELYKVKQHIKMN